MSNLEINYKNPIYAPVFEGRAKCLKKLRSNPAFLEAAKAHYRSHPWDFIGDWGMTFDPRNVERGTIAHVPFLLWPKQVDYLKWVYRRWQSGGRGLVEKSRDCGVTWLSVGFAVSQFLFEDGFVVGFGSRKEILVDKHGDDKSIFEKLRYFIDFIPAEFLPKGWDKKKHSTYMRISNPATGAAITGESGDNIGRGGRCGIYFVDEAAFIVHQEQVDAALSQNTNCQIDISTPNGNGNLFYKKRQKFNNTDRLFVLDWKDDPRKDNEWYERQLEEMDEYAVAQELNRDYNASQTDSFIPAAWVAASIDAHKKLGFEAEGIRVTGFDPADVGDAKAVVNRHGSIIRDADQLTSGDITQAIPWAFDQADRFRAEMIVYDADGMGAPVMKMYLSRLVGERIKLQAYYGSAGVQESGFDIKPVGKPSQGAIKNQNNPIDYIKTNKDTFVNFRAQTWAFARARFENTYNAVRQAQKGGLVHMNPDHVISIDSKCKYLIDLQAELSRPMRVYTHNQRIKVEAKKEMKARGVDSPNLADALIMALSAKIVVRKKKPSLRYDSWGQAVSGVM